MVGCRLEDAKLLHAWLDVLLCLQAGPAIARYLGVEKHWLKSRSHYSGRGRLASVVFPGQLHSPLCWRQTQARQETI